MNDGTRAAPFAGGSAGPSARTRRTAAPFAGGSAGPSARIRQRPALANARCSRPRGISLLEVLAAIGVLSVGLLGLAALLPVGRYTLSEAAKADRAGTCGRAALRNIIVRRMLDSSTWASNPGKSPSFLIDPEGVTNSMGPMFAGTNVPRIGLNTEAQTAINTPALADSVFQATDDLVISLPEEMTNLSAPYNLDPHGRPLNVTLNGTANPLDHSGDYTWFASVTPQPNNPSRFNVSIVVCFKRNRTTAGERAVTVTNFFDQANVNGGSVALGGGSVQLARQINDIPADSPNNVAGINIKENDWVALVSAQGLCRWYRVAAVGDTAPTDTTQYLTLIGPDWASPAAGSDKLVALGQSVVGVYTTTIELDTDPLWKN